MEPTNRRQFLKRSSAVAAAAGIAAAVPTGAARVLTRTSASTEADPTLPEDQSVDVPLVAHVLDARKGTVSLYTGEREIQIKNKKLAATMWQATR